jgi:hypothetical protein
LNDRVAIAQQQKKLKEARDKLGPLTECEYCPFTGNTKHWDDDCPESWGENAGLCTTDNLRRINEELSTLSMRPFLALMFRRPEISEANHQLSRERLIYSPW